MYADREDHYVNTKRCKMISCEFFYRCLVDNNVDFFVGVPDSILKYFCAYLQDNADPEHNITAANEGGAVAIACGHYLATKKPGLVYMQNSGQGNAVNPLVSLADPDIYGIPLVLLIGWRGQPGKKDEPQHIKQGKITLSLLETLGIPYRILPQSESEAAVCISDIVRTAVGIGAPAALIVQTEVFEPYSLKKNDGDNLRMSREDAVKVIADNTGASDIIVSTTGKTSRELYEYRERLGSKHGQDFLSVGSMGHCSQIALGIALAKPSRQVFCLDGDGAVIMHMGSLAIIGSLQVSNFKHIIINNGSHDSVGGQPTAGLSASFAGIAANCGYQLCMSVDNAVELAEKVQVLRDAKGPALLEIKVRKGARKDLGRPKTAPKENKISFMEFISS